MEKMKSCQILIDTEKREKLRTLAVTNGNETTNQALTDLAYSIAVNCIELLDENDFTNLFNLKK
jgi:hypothetical protein